MRMVSSLVKDKRGTGVSMAPFFVATVPAASLAVSLVNCMANKARDLAWNLGDQAMKKISGTASPLTGGCVP